MYMQPSADTGRALIREDFMRVGNYAIIEGLTYVKSSHIIELFLEPRFYAPDNLSKQ